MNSPLLTVFLCVMVHSGAAFAPNDTASGLFDFDSPAVNLAMFAMGWVVTHWMKGSDLPWGMLWCKAWPASPRALLSLCSSSPRASPHKAVSVLQPVDEDDASAADPEQSVAEPSFLTQLLPSVDETTASLLAGVSILWSSRTSVAEVPELPPWRRTCFHSKETWGTQLADYIGHVHWFSECSSPCLVLALIYLDRVLAEDPKVSLNTETCHRLFLTSLVVALKYHDDDFAPYPNACYAEVGEVSVEDLNLMEKQFCKSIGWRFHVRPEEYSRYYKLVSQAASLAPLA